MVAGSGPAGSFAVSMDDTHQIETPEQMALHLPLAGIGSRFLALLVDTLIQIGLGIAMFIIVFVATAGTGSQWGAALAYAGIFAILYGYFICFEILWNGQTPGKRAIGIRVIKETGRPLTAPETIGRNLLRIVDQLPGFYGIGLVAALITKQHKRLGDLVAGSIVVRETELAGMNPLSAPAITPGWSGLATSSGASNGGGAQGSGAHSPMGAAALTIDDLRLIDTFLGRRHSLPAGVRIQMADQILARLAPKLTATVDATKASEDVLEALAHERRSTGHSGT